MAITDREKQIIDLTVETIMAEIMNDPDKLKKWVKILQDTQKANIKRKHT